MLLCTTYMYYGLIEEMDMLTLSLCNKLKRELEQLKMRTWGLIKGLLR